jgi:bifunctional UDP-N-acetylglucosamine pyrophosphorylase / glucosamine-1-phosphate N-acetyltransferase
MMKLSIIILAAGKGTRMYSNLPKVIHSIANKPMLQHVIDSSKELNPVSQFIVVGYKSAQIKESIQQNDKIKWVNQEEQLGTGHAVSQVLPYLDDEGVSLVLYGDVPLIDSNTLSQLISSEQEQYLSLLTDIVSYPQGYGRIIRDNNNNVTKIVEEKDANDEQKKINEVNTGILAASNKTLKNLLPKIDNKNVQQEYYLTDLVSLSVEEEIEINVVHPKNSYETKGVNDRVQLEELERIYQQNRAKELMSRGVQLYDSSRIDIRGELTTGLDCIIDINTVFKGNVTLGNNVSVGAHCVIDNVDIADNVVILDHSIIENSSIGNGATIGPFARIRPETILHDNVKIGNFVEIKKSTIGVGSKVNHLSYVGDTVIGRQSNIGAGTITCNYDGVNKFVTTIGDNVRIGSNCSLIAPVTIGDKATTGAGSSIRKDVNNDNLAINESRQKNITGWKRPEKK